MTIDEKISTEKVRHQRVIKELRELLAVYQNDNDNYRVDRNINQAVSSGFNADNIAAYEDSRKNINPYAEQVKDLQENEDVSTNVPFRNGLFLSIATSYAISKNIKTFKILFLFFFLLLCLRSFLVTIFFFILLY